MALFASNIVTSDSALGSAKIQRSLRFNKADDHYLTRTPSSTGNQKIWTFSAWIKRTDLTESHHYIYSAHSGSDYFAFYFNNDNGYYSCWSINSSSYGFLFHFAI